MEGGRLKLHPALRVKPSEPGRVRCLVGNHVFLSPDHRGVRICPKCKRDKERFGKLGDRAVIVTEVSIPEPDIPKEDLL